MFDAGYATVVLSVGGRLGDWHRPLVQFGWHLRIAVYHTGCCAYKYGSGCCQIALRKGISAEVLHSLGHSTCSVLALVWQLMLSAGCAVLGSEPATDEDRTNLVKCGSCDLVALCSA